MVLRIEHFVGARKACLREDAHVKPADRYQTAQHVGVTVRVWLVEHAFVSFAGGARLVGVDARNNSDDIFHLLLQLPEAGYIIQHCIFAIGGTRAYYKQQLIAAAAYDILDCLIVGLFYLIQPIMKGIHLLDLLGRG